MIRELSQLLNLRDAMLAGLLLVFFAMLLWRAGREDSIWNDEIFTLILIQQDGPQLIDDTATDNHPPGYYFAIKVWNNLGKSLGLIPGIFWLRLPGALLWLVAAVLAWIVGRHVLGREYGGIFAAAIALGGQLAWSQHNVRGYALAAPALIVCFLIAVLMQDFSRKQAGRRTWAALWIGYGFCAAISLWSHLLSAFMLFLMGLWWLGSVFFHFRKERLRAIRHPFVIGGIFANLFALLSFAPWIAELHNQASNLQGPRRFWMTPLTLVEYLRVFSVWFPWGVEGGRGPGTAPGSPPGATQNLVGAFASLLPITAASLAALNPARSAIHRNAAITGIAGIVIGAAYVAFLWGADAAQWQHVFYAPRYTLFGAPMWGAGLCGLAIFAAVRLNRGGGLATWLILPWLACGVAGHALLPAVEEDFALSRTSQDPAAGLPPKGAPLFVMPSEFIPIFKKSLGDYDVRPVEDLAQARAENATILGISAGTEVFPLKDRVISGWIKSGQLSEKMSVTSFPPREDHGTFYTAIRLEGLRPDALNQMASENYLPRAYPAPAAAVAVAPPSNWRKRDGWHAMEIGPDLISMCWSRSDLARIRFEAKLTRGNYSIHLKGIRTSLPNPDQEMKFWFSEIPDERARAQVTEGPFELRIAFPLSTDLVNPILVIEHPVFQLNELDPEANYEFPMGFLLQSAAIVRDP